MRTGTIISLGASALLGLGALVVAKVWLPQAGQHSILQRPDQNLAGTVPVVVAANDIPYGAKLDAHRLVVVHLPAGAVPPGAYSSPGQILGVAGGPPVALTQISAREPILPAKLSSGGARPTVAAVIADGMRAYTIQVSDVAGGGGHILPGDRVDVVLSRDLQITDGGQNKRPISDVVLENVRVLGMDLNKDPASSTPAVAHTATLEVSVGDVEKLAVAAQTGSLSLALRRTGSAEVAPTRTYQVNDLYSVGGHPLPPSRIAPAAAAPETDAAPHPPAKPRGKPRDAIGRHSIVVVHGDTSTVIDVPSERFRTGA
ncbi:MAG: Flp pilus assembly protein CpaB [Caulobacterales bacterium]